MDDLADFILTRPPTAARPLLGLTVLVVEDSRFACEAVRLLCLRSGARIRRADTLKSARRHLQVYLPSVVVVDLGLPDGSGLDLIHELRETSPDLGVILATSGDLEGRTAAMEAGAHGFLEKPIQSLGVFQEAVLSHLPPESQPPGPRLLPNVTIVPDPVAFRDDMAHAADLLGSDGPDSTLDYIAQFLNGVARSASDAPLVDAVEALAKSRAGGTPSHSHVARIAGLVQDRLVGRQAV